MRAIKFVVSTIALLAALLMFSPAQAQQVDTNRMANNLLGRILQDFANGEYQRPVGTYYRPNSYNRTTEYEVRNGGGNWWRGFFPKQNDPMYRSQGWWEREHGYK